MLISSLGQKQKDGCFLKDQVEVWKVEDDEKLEELEQFCSGVYVQRDFSISFSQGSTNTIVCSTLEKVHRSIEKERGCQKYPNCHSIGVANLISCVTTISMVFHEEQVQTLAELVSYFNQLSGGYQE